MPKRIGLVCRRHHGSPFTFELKGSAARARPRSPRADRSTRPSPCSPLLLDRMVVVGDSTRRIEDPTIDDRLHDMDVFDLERMDREDVIGKHGEVGYLARFDRATGLFVERLPRRIDSV